MKRAELHSDEKPKADFWHRYGRWLPSLSWVLAAVVLMISLSFPYWGMVLEAPQYPGGLQMRVFVNRLTGDDDPKRDEVAEIDGLNHYIGMKSLTEAAKIERSIALPAVYLMVALLLVAAVMLASQARRRWTWLLTIPALGFPIVFLGDLAFWMTYFGQNLDPYAPLSSSIQPFTPPILGRGVIGQFSTVASIHQGWLFAGAASILIVVGLVFAWLNHRSAKAS
jgi:hypothetical protein